MQSPRLDPFRLRLHQSQDHTCNLLITKQNLTWCYSHGKINSVFLHLGENCNFIFTYLNTYISKYICLSRNKIMLEKEQNSPNKGVNCRNKVVHDKITFIPLHVTLWRGKTYILVFNILYIVFGFNGLLLKNTKCTVKCCFKQSIEFKNN